MSAVFVKWASRLIIIYGIFLIAGIFAGRFIPQGSQVAYLSQRGSDSFVILLDVDRGLSFMLGALEGASLASDGISRSLIWSPDGQQIAFVTDAYSMRSLNVLTMEGEVHTPLRAQPIGITLDWSVDSQRLIYTAWSVETLWDSFSVAVNPLTEQLTAPVPEVIAQSTWSDYGAVWSPAGTHLAYVSDQRSINTGSVYIAPALPDLIGKHIDMALTQQVTTLPLVVFSPVSWSPDGKHIAFSAYVEDFERQSSLNLYHLDLTLSPPKLAQLTRRARDNISPAWSPDGAWLAYISTRDGDQALYTYSMIERSAQRLTDRQFVSVSAPMWSLDGRKLVFSASDRSGNTDIFLINASGDALTRVTDNRMDDWSPAWRP